VKDLRKALIDGSLGALNPFPFSFMCGNCLGWTVYGYYQRDPFVVAANLPGLVLSIWLNSGASKLQYLALTEARKRRTLRREERLQWGDASRPLEEEALEESNDNVLWNETEWRQLEESFVTVPQERALLRVLCIWAVVIVYVSWFSRGSNPASIIGVVVNLNLIVFYGAPLQTMHTVISTKNSASIHVPTMCMNWLNTSFWIGYGFAKNDMVIIVPNSLGLCLGLAQGVLKALYPSRPIDDNSLRHSIVPTEDEPDIRVPPTPPEEELPAGNLSAAARRTNMSRND
jgi:solute carrier family 50 (sugar transporter)